MALGEWVSVSSQSDSQRALIEKERKELREDPDTELRELTGLYQTKGLSLSTAKLVAAELTEKDALAAHLDVELGIDQNDVASAWQAAVASAIAFTVGALLPMLAILLPPEPLRIPITVIAVLVALGITGATSAWIGGSRIVPATIRMLIGGGLALGATFLVGNLLGRSGLL